MVLTLCVLCVLLVLCTLIGRRRFDSHRRALFTQSPLRMRCSGVLLHGGGHRQAGAGSAGSPPWHASVQAPVDGDVTYSNRI